MEKKQIRIAEAVLKQSIGFDVKNGADPEVMAAAYVIVDVGAWILTNRDSPVTIKLDKTERFKSLVALFTSRLVLNGLEVKHV